MGVFSLSMLQDFLTITKHCEQRGVELSEIHDFIQVEIENEYTLMERAIARVESIKKIVAEKMPRCPICSSQLKIEPINNDPTRMIDDKSKSWWVCERTTCDFDPILNNREPWQEVGDLGIPIHKPSKHMDPRKKIKRSQAAGRQRGCGKSNN